MYLSACAGVEQKDRKGELGYLSIVDKTLSLPNLNLLDRNQTYRLVSAGALTGAFAAVQPTGYTSGWTPRYDTASGVVTLTYSRGALIQLR